MPHMGKRGDAAHTRAVVVAYLLSSRGLSTPWRIAVRLLRADEMFLGSEPTAECVHHARELLEQYALKEERPRRVFLGSTHL